MPWPAGHWGPKFLWEMLAALDTPEAQSRGPHGGVATSSPKGSALVTPLLSICPALSLSSLRFESLTGRTLVGSPLSPQCTVRCVQSQLEADILVLVPVCQNWSL